MTRAGLVGLAVVLAGCSNKTVDMISAPPLTPTVASIVIERLPSSDVLVNDSMTVTFRALSPGGQPIGNAALSIATTSGTTSPITTATDPDGRITIKWRVGATVGPATLTVHATASGSETVVAANVSRSVVGKWVGMIGTTAMATTVTSHNLPSSIAVAGTAGGSGFNGAQTYTVSGITSGASVSWAFTPSTGGVQPIMFTGALSADGKLIVGELNGGGFSHAKTSFERIP